jgi:hypothetical protein
MIVLLKYWHWLAIAGLLAFGVTEWELHNAAKVREGIAIERARVADSTLRVLKPQLARTDTILVRDTVRLSTLVPRLQVIHDTLLQHLTDTVLVKQFIEKADSTVKACTDLMSSCAVFRQQATATIQALESKVAAIQPPRSCVSTGAVWTVLGVGVGFVGAKVVR